MVFAALLIVVLFVILISVLPTWTHSERWGYFPSSAAGIALVVVTFLLLTGAL